MIDVVESIRLKFELLRHVMDERMTRLWAAAEARALGFGGGAIVTAATGIRSKRISDGQRDLDEIEAAPPTDKPREQRIRRPGAGRKPLTEKDPKLLEHLVNDRQGPRRSDEAPRGSSFRLVTVVGGGDDVERADGAGPLRAPRSDLDPRTA
jgi:hypothetical protein